MVPAGEQQCRSAKLGKCLPALQVTRLRDRGWEITSIRVKVQMPRQVRLPR
jgi:hypothetical protein